VTSAITAQYMEVNYIDVKFYETSGFGIKGSDFNAGVPAICPPSDVLLLSGVGLSGTSWASFQGDVLVNNNLAVSGAIHTTGSISIIGCLSSDCIAPLTPNSLINMSSAYSPLLVTPLLSANNLTITGGISAKNLTITGCISTDCITSNTPNTLVNINSATGPYMGFNILSSNYLKSTNLNIDEIQTLNESNINLNSDVHITGTYAITGYDAYFTNIFGTNFYGITSSNILITVREGWRTPVINYYVPNFTQYKAILDQNTNYPTLSTDMLVIVNISANDYRSYGEFEAVVAGNKVAGIKIGNFGTLPNSNVEHALSAGLWIDNEQSMTFIAPSGSSWQVNTLSGYYDPLDLAASTEVSIAVYQQDLRVIDFAGDTMTIGNLVLQQCLSTDCINPYTSNGTIGVGGNLDMNGFSVVNVSSINFTNPTIVNTNSAAWQSSYTTVNTNSADWIGGNSAYTTVNANSATWTAGTISRFYPKLQLSGLPLYNALYDGSITTSPSALSAIYDNNLNTDWGVLDASTQGCAYAWDLGEIIQGEMYIKFDMKRVGANGPVLTLNDGDDIGSLTFKTSSINTIYTEQYYTSHTSFTVPRTGTRPFRSRYVGFSADSNAATQFQLKVYDFSVYGTRLSEVSAGR
jgi:hypothetical protein